MRFPLAFSGPLALVAMFVLGVSCTSDDPLPLYMNMSYQLRCGDCTSNLPNDPVREVNRLDGEDGYSINCIVIESGGKRQISVTMTHNDPDYEFKIVQANLDSKDPGSECQIRATESKNTYVGKCSAAAPTAAKPCQLKLEPGKKIVTGTVLCKGMPNPSQSPPTTRFLVDGLATTDKPASFEVHGCRGL